MKTNGNFVDCDAKSTAQAVWAELQRNGLAEPLRQLLGCDSIGEAYIVGGFPRDVVRSRLEGCRPSPKDADVVVEAENLDLALQRVAGDLSYTALGGFRWKPVGSKIPVDIWQLKNTAWIHSFNLPATIDSFLEGVDLNIDRVAIDLRNGQILGNTCVRALQTRTIDIDALWSVPALRYDEYGRALMASYKTGYRISADLHRRILREDIHALSRSARARLAMDGYTDTQIESALRCIA